MKLSEAIRLGAMLKPQAFGMLWSGGGSCALGAAFDALGVGENHQPCVIPDPHESWLHVHAVCSVCLSNGVYSRQDIIAHLNDWHRWTREQIADWVETIEAQQPVEQLEECEA